jgi:hypothetical protein
MSARLRPIWGVTQHCSPTASAGCHHDAQGWRRGARITGPQPARGEVEPRVRPYLISSDRSIESALKSVKFFEYIGKGCGESAADLLQPLCPDQPRTSGRIPQRASKVSNGLGVVVRALPTGSTHVLQLRALEPDVVHDHIRLRQHQMVRSPALSSASAPATRRTRARPSAARPLPARRAAVSSARVGARPR